MPKHNDSKAVEDKDKVLRKLAKAIAEADSETVIAIIKAGKNFRSDLIGSVITQGEFKGMTPLMVACYANGTEEAMNKICKYYYQNRKIYLKIKVFKLRLIMQ